MIRQYRGYIFRGLRLVIGAVLFVDGLHGPELFLLFIGALFAASAFFSLGCESCADKSCNLNEDTRAE